MTKDELNLLAAYPDPTWLAQDFSGGDWIRRPHLDAIASEITRSVFSREQTRTIVAMPPQHGKSELISHWAPTWFLKLFPSRRVAVASHTAALAHSFGRKVRASFVDTGGTLATDSRAMHHWGTSAGGGFHACGVGGALAGFGADFMAIDDPFKDAKDAASATYRESVAAWFHSVAERRVQPGGSLFIVTTRWHEDDLAGRLVREQGRVEEGGRWRVLSLLAIAEEDDPLGREPGEALWPERYDLDYLEATRAGIGSYFFEALYQQRPSAPEGALFRRSDLRYWHALAATDEAVEITIGTNEDGTADRRIIPLDSCQWIQTIDTAMTTTNVSDYTAIATIAAAEVDGVVHVILIEMDRARVEVPDLMAKIKAAKARHPRVTWQGIEKAASGIGLLQQARREPGVFIRELRADRDKVSRATPLAILAEQGRLHLPFSAEWLGPLEAELLQFPRGAHDDQVDALAYAALACGAGAGEPVMI